MEDKDRCQRGWEKLKEVDGQAGERDRSAKAG